ncbi:MAG: hypothetical protein COA88_14165 [Kordia sp.]|nr:MAG: hypothetical protein COA88_14165 [Kordia sp.]
MTDIRLSVLKEININQIIFKFNNMKKDILNLAGAKALNKNEQKTINGGHWILNDSVGCQCWIHESPFPKRCLSTTQSCSELQQEIDL